MKHHGFPLTSAAQSSHSDAVRSGRISAGAMNFCAPFNSRLKPITTVLTNFGLILHDLCAVWASLSRNNFRFVKLNLCVGRDHYRERYRNPRQQEAKDHPANCAATLAASNSSAQNPVNKTNNKYNHSIISLLVDQWRDNATKFQFGKILLYVSTPSTRKGAAA